MNMSIDVNRINKIESQCKLKNAKLYKFAKIKTFLYKIHTIYVYSVYTVNIIYTGN